LTDPEISLTVGVGRGVKSSPFGFAHSPVKGVPSASAARMEVTTTS